MFPPAPSGPLPLGVAPVDASAEQEQALWWVNTVRHQAGLGPMTQVHSINTAASAHAHYVMANPDVYADGLVSLHQEVSGGSGFTGEFFWDRLTAAGYLDEPYREVIARQPSAGAAVAHWMESLYHRLPVLQPASDHMGYGTVVDGTEFINVMDVGIGVGPETLVGNGVAWPPPGAHGVPLSWDGLEQPQPPEPSNGFPSGPVVTLVFSRDSNVVLTDHQLLDVTVSESELPHTALSPDNDLQMKENNAVALYADSPLEAGRTIEVQITVQLNSVSVVRVWRFYTRSVAGCDVLEQDCGVGKACYTGQDSKGVCHWAGALTAGASCTVQNECAVGMTCVKSLGQCAAYCQWSGKDSQSCSAQCGHGALLVSTVSDLGVCAPDGASVP